MSDRGPGMRRTRWGDLAVPFLIIAITVWVLLRSSYDSLPPLQYVLPVPSPPWPWSSSWLARRVRAAVRHDPDGAGRWPPSPSPAASRWARRPRWSGRAWPGPRSGLLVRLLPDVGTVRAAASDARVAGLLLVAAALLVGAGLLLERAGVDPNNDRRDRSDARS